MEDKIKEYFIKNNLGKVRYIKSQGNWAEGGMYHVKVNRILKPTEYTVYELDNNVKTVRSLQTNKVY